jgi:hypothetical protein
VKSKFLEVTNKANWAKLQLLQWEPSDLARPSLVQKGKVLLNAVQVRRGDAADPLTAVFVRDLQTQEGCEFYPSPEADCKTQLDMHRVWVCPLFYPFVSWLFANYQGDVTSLPDLVELADSKKQEYQGYRRPGEEMEPITQIRKKLLAALRAAERVPLDVVDFLFAALEPEERALFAAYRQSLDSVENGRWVGSLVVESGRYVATPLPGGLALVVPG